jgi:hypothetical protein
METEMITMMKMLNLQPRGALLMRKIMCKISNCSNRVQAGLIQALVQLMRKASQVTLSQSNQKVA